MPFKVKYGTMDLLTLAEAAYKSREIPFKASNCWPGRVN